MGGGVQGEMGGAGISGVAPAPTSGQPVSPPWASVTPAVKWDLWLVIVRFQLDDVGGDPLVVPRPQEMKEQMND